MNFKEEYIRCLRDKTRKYFIEHYLSTFNADERKEVPFKLFPRQIEFLHSLCEKQNTIAIKHRQAGITTVSSAWITGQCVFASSKSPETILCIGNKLDISQQLVEKIGNFLNQVPRWMWGNEYYSPDPKSEKNTKSIYKARNKQYIELFNGCRIHARSSGENAARGISAVSILIFDEAAFIQNGTTVYAQAVAATASVKDAKIIMVSTPNGKDALYYKTYVNALDKKNNYNPVEFKWFQDLRYNRYLKWYRHNNDTGGNDEIVETVIGTKGEIEYNEERWRKLEREGWIPTSPWYVSMCKSFNNDSQKIAQELNVSFLGSSDNVVPVEVIEKQMKSNVIQITDDWKLIDTLVKETWIWKDPIPGHRYICACLPEGENVLTDTGYKNIKDISLKDKLYSLEGNNIGIIKKYERFVNNDAIHRFKLYGHVTTTAYTDNHPIYSSKSELLRNYSKNNKLYNFNERYWKHDFKYVKACDVKSGDWLQIPNIYRNHTLSEDEIEEKWIIEGNEDSPLLNEDFWWFCGMWLAEGCCVENNKHHYRIYTSHNVNETDIHEKVFSIIRNIFKRTPSLRKVNEKEKCANIFFNYDKLAKFLLTNFGKYSYGKFISEWIKFIPEKYKLQLLLGYLQGDGSFVRSKRDGVHINAGSVSLKLLEDFQDILFSIGIVSSVVNSSNKNNRIIEGRLVKCRPIYQLSIGKYYSQDLLNKWNVKGYTDERKRKHPINYIYFSKDKSYIYWRISSVETSLYTGIVYNFETETHNYLTNKMVVHNCDPSSGSGEDSTAIQIIDVDGVDENGIPCFEQVLEYNGKVNGNEVGQLVDRYARIYNDALTVVECIGGYGDSVVLTLMDLGYPNLYYDNPQMKNYTNQNLLKVQNAFEQQKQLPGFRTSALRLQMIANFVDMLKSNAFRVRSQRTINELDTWIFKNGRPDHMDGSHDDLLTCLAMGLFVMQFYMLKSEKQKVKDKCIVKSWYVNNANNTVQTTQQLKEKENINRHNKRFDPFMFDYKKQERMRMAACIMLGGFKVK